MRPLKVIHKIKCTECGFIFTGASREEAESNFKKYHSRLDDMTKRKGSPLWLTDEDGNDILFRTETSDEKAEKLKQYVEKNLNE